MLFCYRTIVWIFIAQPKYFELMTLALLPMLCCQRCSLDGSYVYNEKRKEKITLTHTITRDFFVICYSMRSYECHWVREYTILLCRNNTMNICDCQHDFWLANAICKTVDLKTIHSLNALLDESSSNFCKFKLNKIDANSMKRINILDWYDVERLLFIAIFFYSNFCLLLSVTLTTLFSCEIEWNAQKYPLFI